MGGVTLGIPGIIEEFSVGLNEVINGLISWIVLTLGVGVPLRLSYQSDLRRTSSGLLRLSTLVNGQSFSLLHSLLLPVQFGVRKPSLSLVYEAVEL